MDQVGQVSARQVTSRPWLSLDTAQWWPVSALRLAAPQPQRRFVLPDRSQAKVIAEAHCFPSGACSHGAVVGVERLYGSVLRLGERIDLGVGHRARRRGEQVFRPKCGLQSTKRVGAT